MASFVAAYRGRATDLTACRARLNGNTRPAPGHRRRAGGVMPSVRRGPIVMDVVVSGTNNKRPRLAAFPLIRSDFPTCWATYGNGREIAGTRPTQERRRMAGHGIPESVNRGLCGAAPLLIFLGFCALRLVPLPTRPFCAPTSSVSVSSRSFGEIRLQGHNMRLERRCA